MSQTLLDQLDALFIKELIKRLEKGEEFAKDAEGNLIATSVKPATLAVIAKYLKDNHMEKLPDNPEAQRVHELLAQAMSDMEHNPEYAHD